jgi:hypothetical protein
MSPPELRNAKRAAVDGAHRGFKACDWKAFQKNTLRGFFTLVLPSGLIVKECTFHQRDGTQWIGLPGKPYAKQDGTTSYINILDFESKEARQRFQELALEALETFLAHLPVACG